jgi:putative heme-binding domain-containing protein
MQAQHPESFNDVIDNLVKASAEDAASVRRELASAAIRLADKYDVTPLLRVLMSHKEDAKDPVISQLVWLAYEKTLASRIPQEQGADAPRSPEKELAWLAEHASENPFVREQIVPKVMRRLVATGQPEGLKLCIEFVARVKDAASREKALEGLATALASQTVAAPAAWVALQAEISKDNNPKLTALANKLAVSFRDPEAVKRAVAAATDVKLPVEARTEAVRQIAVLRADKLDRLLLDLLRDDKEIAVRAEAARALAAFNSAGIPNELLKSWKELPKEVHADVVNTLATRKEWAKALLAAMADKRIDRAAVTDNTILRIQAFKDKGLNSLIEKAWGRTRPTPAELTKTIDKARESLYEAPASFARGRVVFENTCGKCHKFDGKGADVGPALEGAARDIEYILGNVIDPNRVIGAPYFLRTARLLDGTIQQGVLAEEDDKSVTLKLENGVIKKIAKDDLESPLQTVEKSLMPEGLGYNMTAQDFRDLVRYVMANPFLADVTVNGKKVSVGVPGRIAVPQEGRAVAIEAEVTAPEEMKTALLIGSSADFEVKLNGHVVGNGRGTGKQVQPDQSSIAVVLPKGTSKVAIIAKGSGAVYARFTDPNRKLRYPDAGAKK